MTARTRKFFSYYKPYRRLFIADMTCAFIVAGISLLLPLCARSITQRVTAGNTPDLLAHIYSIGALMLILIAIQTLCNAVVDYHGHMMGAYIESDLRAELFTHYQKLSFSFYDEQRTGQLMSRISNDLFAISELYHHGPEDSAIALLKFSGAFVILLAINVPLTLIIFAFLPIMAVYALYFFQRMTRALAVSRERIGDINAQVEDTLAGIRVVKSFTNEALEGQKFAHENLRFLESRRAGYRSETWFSNGLIAFTQLITIAVIIFGGVGIVNAGLDAADLVTFLMCVAILIDPIQRAVNIARLLQEGLTGFARFMEVMEIAPDIVNAPDAVDLTGVRGQIEFRDVSFKYRDDHEDVLNNISLTIQAGEYVALVGTSGVGKTTLCSLIPRFYEVTAGAILIDGQNIRDVTLRSLRGSIGVVQQDVYLFAGTVADNIRYGRLDATREEIIAAAQQANAHEFIMRLPQGYDSDIGQRGVKLSGGQKQRLSIARVFLKNPPILILDEATSALDNESERAVRESLDALAQERTTLVIAHRLSTIRNAGRILVLTDVGIAEEGTHDELIARGGSYAALYRMQARV
ncbi:MAG: ABC transporter ATP-binding protein [Anaerolineae bacterium]|nr:ABC transporter ATP-binding protein [Anaerolineae bacterium]